MLIQFASPNLLMYSTMLIGISNLTSPFITKSNSSIRNFLLVTIAICFFFNLLIIDLLFLNGTRTNITLSIMGNYSLGFNLEPLGLILATLIGFLWICASLYTPQYLKLNNIQNSSQFLFFCNSTVLIGILISLSSNLITMFIGYELLTISTAFLIAHSNSTHIRAKLYKYLKILMVTATFLFFPAVLIVYFKTGSGNFIHGGLIKGHFSKNQSIILLLVFIFGISKTAIYPVHRWLPAAMIAHYPVSSLLHAVVVVKIGLFCIYKILLYTFGITYLQEIFATFNWLIFLPITGILYSSIKALSTTNIKNILAYSTMNQVNIALLSSFMLTPKALGAAVLHLVSHAFTKICLFYGMGIIYSFKKVIQIQDLRSVSKEFPLVSFLIFVASLSLVGTPILAGFISKFTILLAGAQQKQILVMCIIIISSIFSGVYLIRILQFIYNTPHKIIISTSNKVPYSMIISIVICGSVIILFYFIQNFIKEFLSYII